MVRVTAESFLARRVVRPHRDLPTPRILAPLHGLVFRGPADRILNCCYGGDPPNRTRANSMVGHSSQLLGRLLRPISAITARRRWSLAGERNAGRLGEKPGPLALGAHPARW